MSQPALKYLEENHERFQNELIELLRIPSISHDPIYKADMDRAVCTYARTEQPPLRFLPELGAAVNRRTGLAVRMCDGVRGDFRAVGETGRLGRFLFFFVVMPTAYCCCRNHSFDFGRDASVEKATDRRRIIFVNKIIPLEKEGWLLIARNSRL